MIRALGLDLSLTATGLALPDGTCRTFRPKAGPDDPGRRLHELVERITARLHGEHADIAIIEAYFVNPKFPRAAVDLAELGGPIRVLLFERNIPYIEIAPAALKLFATGNGNATKTDMLSTALQLGATVANDNEADAWLLRLAALQRYEPRLDRPQLTKSIAARAWPTLRVAA